MATSWACALLSFIASLSSRDVSQYQPLYHTYTFKHSLHPRVASSSTPLPQQDEPVGIAVNGVPLYANHTISFKNGHLKNTLEMGFDDCIGHIDADHHRYHYHFTPYCLFQQLGIVTPKDAFEWSRLEPHDYPSMWPNASRPSVIVGWALDGFPIFGPYDQHGNLMTAGDLDQCNGKFLEDSPYEYGYFLTPDPPHTVACFRGELHDNYFVDRLWEKSCPQGRAADGTNEYFRNSLEAGYNDISLGCPKDQTDVESGAINIPNVLLDDNSTCVSIFLSSVPESQILKEGQYVISGTLNGKQYYTHSSGKFFIYYVKDAWYVGSTLGSTTSAFTRKSMNTNPLFSQFDWECWRFRSWHTCPTVKFSCDAPVGCPSQFTATTRARWPLPRASRTVICSAYMAQSDSGSELPSSTNNYCMRSDAVVYVNDTFRVIHAGGCADHAHSKNFNTWTPPFKSYTQSSELTYCDQIKVANVPSTQLPKAGEYHDAGMHNGMRHYGHTSGSFWIYWLNHRWIVGSSLGSTASGLNVDSNAITPDENTNWTCWHKGQFWPCSEATVTCENRKIVNGCEEVEVYNVPDVQAIRRGVYKLMGIQGFKRYYAHQHQGSDGKGNGNFLYFQYFSNRWMVGYTIGGHKGGLRSQHQGDHQDNLEEVRFDHWDYGWQASTARVKCLRTLDSKQDL